MIYLFTALYDEAYPFLQYYKMKKEINSLPFEMYRCEEQQICLTITGTGEITAATVVAAVCAMGHVKAGDIFVQCGICAGAEQKKGVAYNSQTAADDESGRHQIGITQPVPDAFYLIQIGRASCRERV